MGWPAIVSAIGAGLGGAGGMLSGLKKGEGPDYATSFHYQNLARRKDYRTWLKGMRARGGLALELAKELGVHPIVALSGGVTPGFRAGPGQVFRPAKRDIGSALRSMGQGMRGVASALDADQRAITAETLRGMRLENDIKEEELNKMGQASSVDELGTIRRKDVEATLGGSKPGVDYQNAQVTVGNVQGFIAGVSQFEQIGIDRDGYLEFTPSQTFQEVMESVPLINAKYMVIRGARATRNILHYKFPSGKTIAHEKMLRKFQRSLEREIGPTYTAVLDPWRGWKVMRKEKAGKRLYLVPRRRKRGRAKMFIGQPDY